MKIETIPVTAECPPLSRAEISGMRVLHAVFPPSLVLPLHLHEGTCITVMLQGSFIETIGGREHHCRAASVLSKPLGEPHRDDFSRTGSRQMILELPDPEQERFRPFARKLREIVHLRDGDALALAQRIAREFTEPDEVSELALEALALELLTAVLRRSGTREAERLPAWLERAREFVHDRFADSFSLEELAAEAGVHPGHLARTFRARFGRSVSDYVRGLRVERAAELLRSTDLPLAQVAHRAGFYDQSHLTRLFKRQRGCTPRAFRAAGARR